MRTIKAKTIFTVLLLLGLSLQGWQTTAGQTPKPTPEPDPPLTGGKAILAQAINLLAKPTPESMEAALEMCEKARKAFKEEGDTENEARTLFLMGYINNDLDNKRIALKNFLEVLPLLKAGNDKEMEARVRSYIGLLYAELDEPQKALKAYSLALPIMRETDN